MVTQWEVFSESFNNENERQASFVSEDMYVEIVVIW